MSSTNDPAEGNDARSGEPEGALVEAAWDAVAPRYAEYWVPRFRPFAFDALADFRPLPRGPICVPACGPGAEVIEIAARHPGREILASDLAPAMVEIARRRVAESGLADRVSVKRGDAEELSSEVRGAAGVFSAFALQLLPSPSTTLLDWLDAVAAGGTVTAVFWPHSEQKETFGCLRSILERAGAPARPAWEENALRALDEQGVALLRDRYIAGEIAHASAVELWDRLVDSGPLQATLLRSGAGVIARARREFLRESVLRRKGDEWVYDGTARVWTLQRCASPARAEERG